MFFERGTNWGLEKQLRQISLPGPDLPAAVPVLKKVNWLNREGVGH